MCVSGFLLNGYSSSSSRILQSKLSGVSGFSGGREQLSKNATAAKFRAGVIDGLVVQEEADSGRIFINPETLLSGKGDDVWMWWKQRRLAETRLKNSIESSEVDIRPQFDEYKRFLSLERADILQANEDFIRAISEHNLELMGALWLKSDDVVCLRPNSKSVVRGYENTMEHWKQAFSAPTSYSESYSCSDIGLSFTGDIATIDCVINEMNKKGSKLKSYKVSNVFTREPNSDRHQLRAHIATPIPLNNFSRENSALRRTYTDTANEKPKSQRSSGGVLSLKQLLGGGRAIGLGGEGIGEEEEEDEEDDDDDDDDVDDEDDDDSDDSIYGDEIDGVISLGDGTMEIVGDEQGFDEDDEEENGDTENANAIRDFLQKRIKQALLQQSSSFTNDDYDGVNIDDPRPGMMIELGDEEEEESGPPFDRSIERDDSIRASRTEFNDQLASRTLLAVRWLANADRLSRMEKNAITADVVDSVGQGKHSQAEVAFSIIVGQGRPSENNTHLPMDMSLIDPEDMEEFEKVCKSICRKKL